MTPSSSQDPLAALWQTAPKTDTSSLLRNLQSANSRHRLLNWIAFAIMCGTGLLLIDDAITHGTVAHIALCVAWNLGLLVGVTWYRRAGCHRAEAVTFDTIRLLKFMIARGKRDLRLARCLYVGAPCGAAAGFMIARLTGFEALQSPIAASSHTHLIRTGGGLTALILMMVIGLMMARDRRAQIRQLTETLKSIQGDV